MIEGPLIIKVKTRLDQKFQGEKKKKGEKEKERGKIIMHEH